MLNILKISIGLCCLVISFKTFAKERYQIDEYSQKRSVCGMTIAKKHNLTVDAKEISDVSRFSRASNLRYNACPYTVILKYQDIKMTINFSNDPTLDQIINFDDGPGNTLRFGTFNFNEKGWNLAEGYDPKITVQNFRNNVFVIGEFNQKDEHSSLIKSCIDILVIGTERWAIGGICPPPTALPALKSLFIGTPILTFEK